MRDIIADTSAPKRPESTGYASKQAAKHSQQTSTSAAAGPSQKTLMKNLYMRSQI